MSPLTQTLLATLASVLGCVVCLWLIGTWKRDVSLVDVFWGLGFVLIVSLALAWNPPDVTRPKLLAACVGLWGLRLAGWILWRNWGHGEDRRYAAMREHHGARFWWVSLLTVFLLQGILMWVISLPLQLTVVKQGPAVMQPTDWLGVLLFAIGFFFEALGDWQLALFRIRAENRGRVLDTGLWRYTRHPNYFGETLIWWGFWLISLGAGAGWTVFSPLLMTGLLLKVSGVSLLESTITERRPEYAAYQQRTSAFIPWPPRRTP